MMPSDNSYSEHERLDAVRVEYDAVVDFLNCSASTSTMCVFSDATRPAGQYVPDPRTPEQLAADYFGIDLKRIEAERRAILGAYQTGHTPTGAR